jgi:hypothetical protein
MYLRILLVCALTLPLPLLAQPAAADVVAAPVYAASTGDVWVDRQLADINRYADWYPDAFLDELFRYADVPQAYAAALLEQHGWLPGDLYFAVVWGKVSGIGYREVVRAWTEDHEGGWKSVVTRLPVEPQLLHWRALRHRLVASYDHWDRPIQLDMLLRQQLGDRAQRDQAALAEHAVGKP